VAQQDLRAGENPAARLLSIESTSLPFLAHPGRLRRPLLVERFADQVDRRSAVLLGLEGIGREEGKRRHDRDEQQEYRSHLISFGTSFSGGPRGIYTALLPEDPSWPTLLPLTR